MDNFDNESGMAQEASVDKNALGAMRAKMRMHWEVECFGKDGKQKWLEKFENLVVDEGLDEILEQYFNGSGYNAAHYVGLKDTGAPDPGDTMGSHGSWATITPYSDGTDPLYDPAAASGQSITNAASKAVFNINAPDEVFGAFLKTDSTKGGSIGQLYGVGDFGASRNVEDGDTLNVTIVATQAAA